jgi:HK97 family phage portal protein
VASLIGRALGAQRPRNATPVPIGSSSGALSMPGLAMGSNDRETFLRTYGSVGTIFSIVSLYASSTARAPWQMFESQRQDSNRYTTRDEGSDQRKQVMAHAALTLLNKPNPFWTGFRFRELGQTYLELTGECYIVVERHPRSPIPIGLWLVRPDRMQPVPDPDNYLAGYIYTSPDGRERIPLQTNEVISIMYPNPLDMYHGLGPIQSVLVDIDAARYGAEWNRNYFINSAEPGGVIEVDHELQDDEWQNLMERWREGHRGVARAHRVAVLENGQKWIPNQHSAKDMDFSTLRDQARDIFREAFRMHKVMVGVSDDVNRANAQTGEEIFASWGVVPRLDRWADALNSQYLPLFGSTAEGRELDYVTPVPANREQDNVELLAKSQSALFLSQAGFERADIPKTVGLPDMAVAPSPPAPVSAPPAPKAPEQGGQGDADGMGNRANPLAAYAGLDGGAILRMLSAPYNQLLTGAGR